MTTSISYGSILKIAVVLIIAWALYLLRDLILIVLVSIIIASALEPAAKQLSRLHLPRVLAVLIIYLITFGLFFGLLPFLVLPIVSDVTELSVILPERIGDLSSILGADSSIARFADGLGTDLSTGDLLRTLQAGFAGVPRGFVQTASLVFGGFFSFILIIVISFYLAVQDKGIENFLRLITPNRHEPYVLDLWRRSYLKIGYWLQGQLLLGLIVGVLVFLGLTILGVNHALSLAILAALFELIPYFGPILSAIPAAFLGFTDSLSLGLMVVGLYIIIQQFENHLIYPLVVKKIVGVPPLIVILSLLAGVKLFGLLGLILSIPIAVVLMEVANDVAKRKSSQHADVG